MTELFKIFPKDKATEVAETQYYASIKIETGATLTVPEGKKLTLTSNGIEMAPVPGMYTDVWLTVTDNFIPKVHKNKATDFRTALYVDQNGIDANRSVPAALIGGTYNADRADGVKLRSQNDYFSGFFVTDTDFKIDHADIMFNGACGDDFGGNGAVLVTNGTAKVTIENTKIINRGVQRSAFVNCGNSELTVKNCDITTVAGTYEENQAIRSGMDGWIGGICGNARTSNVIGKAKATYIDCTFRSDNWGILSTDDVDPPDVFGKPSVELIAKNCKLEYIKPYLHGCSYVDGKFIEKPHGYGSYCIGACRNVFDNCQMDVADYGVIIANENAGTEFINGTVCNCDRIGMMWHSNQGGKSIIKDSSIHAKETVFLVRGCYPQIEVENSTLTAEDGVIFQLMDNDDPGMSGGGLVVDTAIPVKDAAHNVYEVNRNEITMFGETFPAYITDAVATFRNVNLEGDFYNGFTNAVQITFPGGMPPHGDEKDQPDHREGLESPEPGDTRKRKMMMPSKAYPINMVLSFEASTVVGIISSATTRHYVPELTPSTRFEISHVYNTVSPAVNNGVIVSFDASSVWTVTGDCYLTSLTTAEGTTIQAPEGKKLSITVNGMPIEITAGTITGNIAIRVS